MCCRDEAGELKENVIGLPLLRATWLAICKQRWGKGRARRVCLNLRVEIGKRTFELKQAVSFRGSRQQVHHRLQSIINFKRLANRILGSCVSSSPSRG